MHGLYRNNAGFAYIALLFTLAGLALLLGITTEQIEHAAQRDREEQLLFVGKQFRQAIASYYEQSPGIKQYPRKLEELLRDNRFPKPMRHLRRIYTDPMSNQADLQLMRNAQGGIVGVYSGSELRPIRTQLDADLMTAINKRIVRHYSDWKFVYQSQEDGADLVRPDNSGNDMSDPSNPFGQLHSESELQPKDITDAE